MKLTFDEREILNYLKQSSITITDDGFIVVNGRRTFQANVAAVNSLSDKGLIADGKITDTGRAALAG